MQFESNPYTNILHKHPFQECRRCIMNTSDPWIYFDGDGVCNHCSKYDSYDQSLGDEERRTARLGQLVDQVKARGRNKSHDCIMGLSGGVDSSYLAWYATNELGLRVLAVHIDTGWNSELAVDNINSIVEKLGLDLHTLVLDWPSIRDIQRAYFLSGIANLDVPQDHAFIASLYSEAREYGLRDILSGGNYQTEAILPPAWGYDAADARSLKDIHRRFGTMRIDNFPTIGVLDRMFYKPYVQHMQVHRPLDLIPYRKEEAKTLLKERLGWRDYGGKHYESRFTKFFQGHYLPTRYGYDKRLAHLSSLVTSGQMDRGHAMAEMQEPLYAEEDLVPDRDFWIRKLDLSLDDYERVMSSPPVSYKDFKNSEALSKGLRATAGRLAAVARRRP